MQDTTGIDFRDLGLAAYLVARHPLRGRRLVRLHRVRPRTNPGVSGIVWRPDTGVIGLCVSRGRDVGLDLSELDAELAEVTAAEWAALPQEKTLGLRYDEWTRIRGTFGVVVATPLVDERRDRSVAVGCVALDGPAGSLGYLISDDVRAQLASAAASIARVIL